MPKSEAEVSIVQQRLQRAGYRDESAVKIFYGSKVLVPLLLCVLALVTGLCRYSPFFVYCRSPGPGLFWRRISGWEGELPTRQTKIRRGLPDVLDLLVICIEAGLSLDQATARTGDRIEISPAGTVR